MEDSVNLQITSPKNGSVVIDAEQKLAQNYRQAAPGLPGSERWIRELRSGGMEAFADAGLPHRRVEQWRYTDLRSLLTEVYEPASAAHSLTREALDERLGALAGVARVRAVFVNGWFDPALSELGGLESGVEFLSLSDALASPPEWLPGVLGAVNPAPKDVVSALNAAFMTGGAVIRVTAGAKTGPVHLIYVTTGVAPLSVAVRNVVLVSDGAETSLIETFLSDGEAVTAQTIAVSELLLADGAKARHVKVVLESGKTLHLGGSHVRLGAGSVYDSVEFSVGGSVARRQSFIKFTGEGARVDYAGAQMLRGRQHCDMTLVVDHAAASCQSRELVKAVLDGESKGVFQGKVIVRPGAQKTDGKQMSRGLLLSERAEFDAKPELEIYADDVACGHGATAGELDDDLLFYLQARGIPEAEARALMIMAFVGEALDHIADETLREALVERASAWLK
jgi:Fe-S cluster assembly protein SufD